MISSVLLWSAIRRMAKQTMSAWRAAVVGMILCLMVVAGCDVRPFNELFGHDSEEDTDTDTDETPDAESLVLTASPESIVISENTPQTTVQVTVVDRDPSLTYTFTVTDPENGTATIDNNGLLTFTPDTDSNRTGSLVVTVTDNGDPVRSGNRTISITVNPG
jgi:hypothetical protein